MAAGEGGAGGAVGAALQTMVLLFFACVLCMQYYTCLYKYTKSNMIYTCFGKLLDRRRGIHALRLTMPNGIYALCLTTLSEVYVFRLTAPNGIYALHVQRPTGFTCCA